jgi:hypothetical protein
MSASKTAHKFDPVKFIDQLMADGKRRSERQIKGALVDAYTDLAEQDFQSWLRARNTTVDQGLRWDERGPYNGKKDSFGTPTRYGYWRVEQDPDKVAPGDPLKYLPNEEEARVLAVEEAEAFESAEKARLAKMAGIIEE